MEGCGRGVEKPKKWSQSLSPNVTQRPLRFLREANIELLAAARAASGMVDEAPGGAPAGFLDAPAVVEELAILPSQALRSAGRKRH